jgi:hypothetical protein
VRCEEVKYGFRSLVAPQGFTDVINKRDINVFHSIPHAFPHTQNRDSNFDLEALLRTLKSSET